MRYRHKVNFEKSFTDKEWRLIELAFERLLIHLPTHSKSAGAQYSDETLELDQISIGETSPGNRRIVFAGKNRREGGEFICRTGHDFCLNQRIKNDESFDEIDTSRYPYDLVVCAMLFFLKIEFPKLVYIHSDGTTDDWHHAVKWASQVLYQNQHVDYHITDEIAQLAWLEVNPSRSFKRFEAVLKSEVQPNPTINLLDLYTDERVAINWFY